MLVLISRGPSVICLGSLATSMFSVFAGPKSVPPVPAPPAPNAHGAGALSINLSSCSKSDQIAVLGGSFDPITTGHLKVACEIVHTGVASEVWIVPCGVRPDKPSLKTPYMHRLLLCHLAVCQHPHSRPLPRSV